MDYSLINAAGNILGFIDARHQNISPEVIAYAWSETEPSAQVKAEILCVITTNNNEKLSLNFWNPDSTRENLCGNAIRCLSAAISNGNPTPTVNVNIAGHIHKSTLISANESGWRCPKKAIHIITIDKQNKNRFLVDTGTLHLVEILGNDDDIHAISPKITCHTNGFKCNHTIVKHDNTNDDLLVRVFERGVGETKSCGSAAVSTAITAGHLLCHRKIKDKEPLNIKFVSGEILMTSFDSTHIHVSGKHDIISRQPFKHEILE